MNRIFLECIDHRYKCRRRHLNRFVVAVITLAVMIGGCFAPEARFPSGSGWRAQAVPAVDDYIVDLQGLGRGSTPQDVKDLLGEPLFQLEQKFDNQLTFIEWRYPIRHISILPLLPGANAQRRVVPAVVLRIRLDAAGRVAEWGFFHPVTGVALEIGRSLAQADALFMEFCNPPKRIELDTALRTGTEKDEVLARMRWFDTVSKGIEQAQYQILKEGSGETLVYYADHPSPLYVPPMYVVVVFNVAPESGTAWHFESSFDGCE